MAASERLLPTPDSVHVDSIDVGLSEDIGIVADFQNNVDDVDGTEVSSASAATSVQRPVVVNIEPMQATDFPKIYKSKNQIPLVKCQVCQKLLNIEARLKDALVICPGCKEATPLRAPPSGKRYVRCLCNRLHVLKKETPWSVCLRPGCGKVVHMGQTKKSCCAPSSTLKPEDIHIVTCYHCKKSVFWNIKVKTCYCPQCGARSTISGKCMLLWAAFYAIAALVNLASGILILTFNSIAETSTLCKLGYSGSIVVGLLNLILALYMGCTKVSHVEGPLFDIRQAPKQREFEDEMDAGRNTRRQKNVTTDCDSGIVFV